MEDKILLKEATDGNLSMKLLYMVLDSYAAASFSFQFICTLIPTKVGFLPWEASKGKVLNLDQLTQRDRLFANRCFLCEE